MNYSKYHMVLQACRTSSRVILQTTNTALNGALDHDLNRDIDMIIYDQLGNLQDICFYDHSTTEYIYAADGTKLRTIHHPASSSSLTDSIDYIGNLILKNDKPLMYLFGGGYATSTLKQKIKLKMKKLNLLLATLSLSTMAVSAQNEARQFSLKPMVGITVAELRNVGYVQYGPKVGFSGGLEAEYGITPQLGISLGAIYSQQGGKYDTDVENSVTTIVGTYIISEEKTCSKVKVDYINIPLLANFYVWRGMALKAGVQLGILVHDKMNYHYQNIPYIPNDEPYPLEDNSNHTWTKMTDFGKSIDFGIPVGLSYEYHDFIVDARYYFGLTKIDSPNFGCNRGFYLNLGYRIGL